MPFLLQKAWAGDSRPFTAKAMEINAGLRMVLCFGMLRCAVWGGDIPRIDPAEITALTEGTFLGDGRVRREMAVARFRPNGRVPRNYGDPVRSGVPLLLLSGTHDPVTPPGEWPGRRCITPGVSTRSFPVPT